MYMDFISGFHMIWQLENGEIEPVNLWDLRSGKLTVCELENHHFFSRQINELRGHFQ